MYEQRCYNCGKPRSQHKFDMANNAYCSSSPDADLFTTTPTGDVMKCPKCNDGFAGTDRTGEAIDCHYCDANGNITVEMYVAAIDKQQELIGDAMAMHARLEELATRWEVESRKHDGQWYNDCVSIDAITEELRQILKGE